MQHLARLNFSTLLTLRSSLILYCPMLLHKKVLDWLAFCNSTELKHNLLLLCCEKGLFTAFKILTPFILLGSLAFIETPGAAGKGAASLLFTAPPWGWGHTVFFRGGAGCVTPAPSVPAVVHRVPRNGMEARVIPAHRCESSASKSLHNSGSLLRIPRPTLRRTSSLILLWSTLWG